MYAMDMGFEAVSFVLVFVGFFVFCTLDLVRLHTRVIHELRRGAEVVRESDLRVELRHCATGRSLVKQSVLLRVLMRSDLRRPGPGIHYRILEHESVLG